MTVFEVPARPTWDAYWLQQCRLVASMSTCLTRQTGAVAVRNRRCIATGFNGNIPGTVHCTDGGCVRCAIRAGTGTLTVPPEVATDEQVRQMVISFQIQVAATPAPAVIRPGDSLDLCTCVHAEVNAVAQCARYGASTDGVTVYCTTRPCLDCTKLMAVAGIVQVVYDDDYPVDYPPSFLPMRHFIFNEGQRP